MQKNIETLKDLKIFNKKFIDEKSMNLGYITNRFKGISYLKTERSSDIFVFGSPICSGFIDETLISLCYQSLYKKKGFILFECLSSNSIHKIINIASIFNRADDIVIIDNQSYPFKKVDINDLITNNKIIIFVFTELERQSLNSQSVCLEEIATIIENINKTKNSFFSYSIFFNQVLSMARIDDKLAKIFYPDGVSLKEYGINLLFFQTLYNYINPETATYIINNVSDLIVMKQPDTKELRKYLKISMIGYQNLKDLDPKNFYYFKNKELQNKQQYTSNFIRINNYINS